MNENWWRLQHKWLKVLKQPASVIIITETILLLEENTYYHTEFSRSDKSQLFGFKITFILRRTYVTLSVYVSIKININ